MTLRIKFEFDVRKQKLCVDEKTCVGYSSKHILELDISLVLKVLFGAFSNARTKMIK